MQGKVSKSNLGTLTLPQTGHLPPSFPLLAASCILEVTRPWDPKRWRSNP